MDVSKTSPDASIEKRYAEIAEKTAAAIVAEGLPPIINNEYSIKPFFPQLPRYEPPLPLPPRSICIRECRMFFPTSGHLGFDTIKLSDELPPIEIVRKMIIYETYLRLSNSIQELMDEYHKDENAVTFIHDLVQQHVVEHFGYRDVNALRTALFRFSDDSVIQTAFYVKHNKISQGQINQGQYARDIDLYTTEGQPTTLFSQMIADQPLLILAGSTS